MKICYIALADSVHTQKWVNYFARRGHKIHLFSSRPGEGYAEGVQLHLWANLSPLFWIASEYISWLLRIIQIRGLIKRVKPDILEAQYVTLYGYLAIASGFHPVVLVVWGSDVLLISKQGRIYRLLTKYSLKKADLVVCDSETVKKELLRLGTDPVRIRMVYNGIDTQQFSPHPANELRDRLGSPVIISTRALRPIYNIEMLIKAIPLVLKQVPQAAFVIVGDGEQRAYLEGLANSLKVSNNVRFTGWIPNAQLPDYLASSDIYVSTSLSDSTSLSLQEAMACELAPVVTDLPANREWIKDGENGFLVPVNDVATLADRITCLIKDGETREKFGKTNRKIIQQKAEYQKEMSKMEKLYQQLVKK